MKEFVFESFGLKKKIKALKEKLLYWKILS